MANPVTLAEVQQHLRLGTLDANEQAEITMMITTATELAESFCNRAWRSGSSTALFDGFPASETDALIINGDVQSVDSIGYYDTDHASTSYTTFRFINVSGRTKIYPSFGTEWPTDSNDLPGNITVSFTAGDEGSVPSSVKSAILLMVGDLYENRENTPIDQGITSVQMSMTAERLLFPYKTRIA